MKDILDWTFRVLREQWVDVTKEIEEWLLIEMRLAFKRIEWHMVNRIIKWALPDDLLQYQNTDD